MQLRAALRTALSRSAICLATSFSAALGFGWHTDTPNSSMSRPSSSRHSANVLLACHWFHCGGVLLGTDFDQLTWQ